MTASEDPNLALGTKLWPLHWAPIPPSPSPSPRGSRALSPSYQPTLQGQALILMSWSSVICPQNLFSTSFSSSPWVPLRHNILSPLNTQFPPAQVALSTLTTGANAPTLKALSVHHSPPAPQLSIFAPLPGFNNTSLTPVCLCLAFSIPLKSTNALCECLFLLLLSAS